MEHFVYVLESETLGRLYIGYSTRVQERLDEHNRGKNKSTRGRGPWVLLHACKYPTRQEALSIERKLKNWKSPKRVKSWIFRSEKD